MTQGVDLTLDDINRVVRRLKYKLLDGAREKGEWYITLEDKVGYRYYGRFKSLIRSGSIAFVGKTNPFSLYNISLWMGLNRKDFILDSDNVYTGSHDKLKFFHSACREYFWSNWNNIYNSETGCPNCNISKGEFKIFSYLKAKRLQFNIQKSFPECYYKGKLKFDFYLPKYNIAIEYQGIQHYKEIAFFNTGGGLKGLKARDRIKTKFCKDNNINLLIIPYWKFDSIEEILAKALCL